MSPEMLNKESYNFKTDVWSVGTILYELLVGHSLYKSAKCKEDLKFKVMHGTIKIPFDLNLSKECFKFVNYCLTYCPHYRPNWQDLLNHNFIQLEFS